MVRVLALAMVVLAALDSLAAQAVPVLHITVSVTGADRRLVAVARHALLISDEPPTSAPKRAVTSGEGTADVRLRPGRYIVESDRPLAIDGRSYEWRQVVDVPAGRDVTLSLTAENAIVGTATAEMKSEAVAVAKVEESSPSAILTRWQDSVVALWTARARAAGVLVGADGLVATSRRAIGDATTVEVQVSPSLKVTGTVLVSDTTRDVAVLQIDPAAIAGVRPVPLACDATVVSGEADLRDLTAIEVPRRGPKDVSNAYYVGGESAGGPVFANVSAAVGLTSPGSSDDPQARAGVRVVRAADVCLSVAAAEAKLANAPKPATARLPIEPDRPLPLDAVKALAAGRAFSLSGFKVTSADFDIVFITPVLLAGADALRGRTGGSNDDGGMRAVSEFGNWSAYVADAPPVLMIRVTPRLAESFWMKVARGAASTQGAAIPPIMRLRPGFSQMRVLCGKDEVTPIHPFKIAQPTSETEYVDEGFYVFDPAAIGPHCGTVSLVLSSVKDAARTETRVVDAALIKRVWDDFSAIAARSAGPKHDPAAR